MNGSSQDRIFISYAHEDLPTVHKIVAGLKKRKLNPWFDKEDLKPGEWMPQIEKAVPRSRYFIICISPAALKKTGDDKPGFIDKELNAAYKIADRQPDTEFAIVPVRLEDCDRGDFRLTAFQQYDLFDDFDNNLDRLAVALGGISLADASARDERTENEKMTDRLTGKAEAAYFAGEIDKAQKLINTGLAMGPDHVRSEQLLEAKIQILIASLPFLGQESPLLFDNIVALLSTAAKDKDRKIILEMLKKTVKEFENPNAGSNGPKKKSKKNESKKRP